MVGRSRPECEAGYTGAAAAGVTGVTERSIHTVDGRPAPLGSAHGIRRAGRAMLRGLAANAFDTRPLRGLGARHNLRSSFCFLPLPHLIVFSILSLLLRLFHRATFQFPPARGWGAPTGARVPARHPDLRAITGARRLVRDARVSRSSETLASRRSTWRFCGPCPCFPLSGIPCGVERQPCSPPGSYSRRTGSPGPPRGTAYMPAGDATCLAPRQERLMKRPSMSEAGGNVS